jgi:hypothetical protein
MAAIAIAPKVWPMQYVDPIQLGVTTLTTGDWINLTGCRGVNLPASVGIACSTANNAPDVGTCQYGIALSTAAYATVTTTSIAVDGANADNDNPRIVPFYAKCKSGEIVEVTADSTPKAATSTWTIRRGCLGTTPTAIADNDYFCICNQIVISSTRVGFATGVLIPMPQDPGSKPFA